MRKLVLASAGFGSLRNLPVLMAVQSIQVSDAKSILSHGYESAVGKENVAAVLSTLLGFSVAANPSNAVLQGGMDAVIAQFSGSRIDTDEGHLPRGTKVRWFFARLYKPEELSDALGDIAATTLATLFTR